MMNGLILKDETRADENETVESLNVTSSDQ